MAGRFSVEAVFRAVDRVTAPVTRMQNRVNRFTRSTSAGFTRLNRNVDRFTANLKKGAAATVAALAVTSGAMAAGVTSGAQFEQTLVNAAAKFPGEIRKGTAAFEGLEQAARRTGSTTEFTASQSAEALNFLAMAGFNAEASIVALPGVVDLATAAQVDLATATDVATDSLGAFGLMTDDTAQLGKNLARVNDVIAKTTTSANTTVESLFETIKDGAPVATTAGASLETFAALAGELANAGIKGSRAGTTLKNIFLSLAAPAGKGAKILHRLGVATQTADGDMRGIVDILGDLGASLDGLGTAERSGVLEGIFGKIPIAGVNVLLATGADRLRAYTTELEGASGASSAMASVMRDTVQGRLNSLRSAVEGVTISIFSMNKGPLADTITSMTEWVRANEAVIATKITEFITSIVDNFESIVTWAKRVGTALVVFTALNAALKLVSATMVALNLIMSANPIVLGVMAAVAAVALLIAAWRPIKSFFKGLWAGVLGIFDAAVSNIMAIVDKVRAAVAFVTDSAATVAGALGFGEEGGERRDVDRRGRERSPQPQPQVVSPQDRVASSISESTTTNTDKAVVTIRDETGRAAVTSGAMGGGLTLIDSGGF